jgi:hypothetical protein
MCQPLLEQAEKFYCTIIKIKLYQFHRKTTPPFLELSLDLLLRCKSSINFLWTFGLSHNL